MSALIDRVGETVPAIRPGRALLTLLVGAFWLAGFVAGSAVTALSFALAAVKVGWRDARRPARAT